jgi:hypothetical protein
MSGLGKLIKNLFHKPSDIISEKLPRAFNSPSFCECFVDNKKVSLTLRGAYGDELVAMGRGRQFAFKVKSRHSSPRASYVREAFSWELFISQLSGSFP